MIGSRFIESALNNAKSQINSRAHGNNDNKDNVFANRFFPILIYKFFSLKMHHPHTEKGSQTDKDRIYEIEIKSTEKVNQVAGCQSISCRTKWRHQCSGDGNTRYHISFLLGRESHNTGQSTEESYKNIINGRRCTRQEFRLRLSNRGKKKINSSGGYAECSRNKETLQRAFHQFKIIHSNGKPHSHNRPHQRRDQHRTDYYGSRVHIQSQ